MKEEKKENWLLKITRQNEDGEFVANHLHMYDLTKTEVLKIARLAFTL
nr:MAG TPA: hypothetical protein [Microviridae sp.]